MEIALNSSVDVKVDIKSLGISSCDRITYCSASFVKNDFSYCTNKCFGKCISNDSYLEQSSLQNSSLNNCCLNNVCKYKLCLETDLYDVVYENDSWYIVISVPKNAEIGLYSLLLKVFLTNPQTVITKTYDNIITFISGLKSDKHFTIRIKSVYDNNNIVYSKLVYDYDLNEYQNIINQSVLKEQAAIKKEQTVIEEDVKKLSLQYLNVSSQYQNVSSLYLNISSKFPIQTEDISSDSITYDKLSQEVRKKIEDAYSSGGGTVVETTKHVMLSYNEYIKIKYPDPDTIYFIYDNSAPVIPDPKPTTSTIIKDYTIIESGAITDAVLNTQAELQNYTLKWQQ